jgi:hypothetical protein
VTFRLGTSVFALLCAGGSAAALGLAVHEALQTAPVLVEVVSTSRDGLDTVARVEVRNTTPVARCLRIRLVAQDRAGRNLATAADRRMQLSPHEVTHLSATLVLTARQYAEQLAAVRAELDGC